MADIQHQFIHCVIKTNLLIEAVTRSDSDIVVPYGLVTQTAPLPPSVEGAIAEYGVANTHLANKEPRAAWFVSHCHTESHREQYVTQLQQFYPVDIYGSCGELQCTREEGSKCWEMVEQRYKYYLAFENSVCADYVTEKLFDALKVRNKDRS